jgi:AraC-like DNA-binding protein
MSDCLLGYINWHWHEEIQFSLVTRGEIAFRVGGGEYRLQEGEGIFINSERLHTARPVGDPESSYLCLDFHPRLLGFFSGSVQEQKYVQPYVSRSALEMSVLRREEGWQKEILDRLEEVARLYDEAAYGYEVRIAAAINLIWLSLLEHRREDLPAFSDRSNDLARQVMAYLGEHYASPVRLADVAKRVGFSESECCRLFKQVTGETIFAYLRALRISRSIELLGGTDRSVSEIAYETGFCGASYYIESFRREMGLTPLKYREQNQTGGRGRTELIGRG